MRDHEVSDSLPSTADTPESELLTFFSSYYRATASGENGDSMTIGTVSEPESRFHYNACENAIIRALTRRIPLNGQKPAVWRFTQERRGWNVLDVGSGTGHWVDFFRFVPSNNGRISPPTSGFRSSTWCAASTPRRYERPRTIYCS